MSAAPPARSLATLPPGSRGVLARIPDDDAALTIDLAALRLLPGEPVHIVQVVPLGGPVLVLTAGGLYAIGRALAARLIVADA